MEDEKVAHPRPDIAVDRFARARLLSSVERLSRGEYDATPKSFGTPMNLIGTVLSQEDEAYALWRIQECLKPDMKDRRIAANARFLLQRMNLATL